MTLYEKLYKMFGEAENRLMVQERIFGEEYIVNTISRNFDLGDS